MAFKDELSQLIEQSGGQTAENLSHIAKKAREIVTDFSELYLRMLLRGLPPRDIDREGLAHALKVREHKLLSGEDRQIAEFAAARVRSDALIEKFCSYMKTSPQFRAKSLSELDLQRVFDAFISSSEAEDERELFGLDD